MRLRGSIQAKQRGREHRRNHAWTLGLSAEAPPQIKSACTLWKGGDGFLCKAFLTSQACLFNYPSPLDYRPPPALPNLQFRKETVKRLLPFRAWEGAAALCCIVAASREGWKVRTFWLSQIGAEGLGAFGGDGADRREACSSGVFFFLRVLAPASALAYSHPCGLATVHRRRRGSISAGARSWGLRQTSPGKRCPGSFPKSRQLCSPGRHAGARHPRHPPLRAVLPFTQALREDRVSACACPAPRSVQLFVSGTRAGVGETSPGPLGWEKRPAGSIVSQRPAL